MSVFDRLPGKFTRVLSQGETVTYQSVSGGAAVNDIKVIWIDRPEVLEIGGEDEQQARQLRCHVEASKIANSQEDDIITRDKTSVQYLCKFEGVPDGKGMLQLSLRKKPS